jgi:hypothetical protein
MPATIWPGKRNPFDVPDVSLISLIATPDKYDGKYIRIAGIGYFDSKGAVNAVFLTREDKRKANGANAIFLNFGPTIKNADKLNDKFVVVQGTFVAHNRGHLGFFAASLYGVDRVTAITTNLR